MILNCEDNYMKRNSGNFSLPVALLLLLCFLGSIQCQAQERQILSGKIITDSIQDKTGVHVININAEKGTTTDEQGNFKIVAKLGDSIYFSSVQFENENVVVTMKHLENGLNKQLMRKFNELDEVQIDDIRLSGVLSEDVTRMPKSVYEKYGMPFPKPRRSSLELAVQNNVNDPVTAVLNYFNGKTKQLEKSKENNEQTKSVNKGLLLMGEAYFTNGLDLPREEIINFLYYCSEDNACEKLLEQENAFALMEIFSRKIKAFKELRDLP